MKRQLLLMAVLLCIAGQRVWGDNVTYLKLDFGDGNTTSISEVTNGTLVAAALVPRRAGSCRTCKNS